VNFIIQSVFILSVVITQNVLAETLSGSQPPMPYRFNVEDAINSLYGGANGKYLRFQLKEIEDRLKKKCRDMGGTPSEGQYSHHSSSCEIKVNGQSAHLICPPSQVNVECENIKSVNNSLREEVKDVRNPELIKDGQAKSASHQ
jgi:hypothetical protein